MRSPEKFIPRLTGISLTACLVIFLLSFLEMPRSSLQDPDLSLNLRLCRSDDQRTALELRNRDESFRPYGGEKTAVKERFAYLWLTISNRGDSDREIMVGNLTRNYYTELLQRRDRGVVTLYRHGDAVSPALWPVKHNRPLFPVPVPGNSEINLVLEFHGPRGIVVDPAVLTIREALALTAFYRSLEGSLYGMGFVLILLLGAAGILRRQRLCLSAALFGGALLLFSARQSRVLLLLISPLSYPEWLFPLSIYANSAASVYFGFTLFRGKLTPLQKNLLRGLLFLGGVPAVLSTLVQPYLMADLLNLNGLVILALLLFVGWDLVRRGQERVKAVMIAFLPWIVMMVWDILAGYLGMREVTFSEYRQLFGLLTTLTLLSLVVFLAREDHGSAYAEREELRPGSGPWPFPEETLFSLEQEILQKTGQKLLLPLDSIIAASRLLSRELAEPVVAGITGGIIAEAESIKGGLYQALEQGRPGKGIPSGAGLAVAPVAIGAPPPEQIPELTIPAHGRVLLFQRNLESSRSLRLILRAEGFLVTSLDDPYEVLTVLEKEEPDVLLVDPVSSGEAAFSLCSLVRTTRNILQLPILMISSFHNALLMRKGYAAGVNDFLTQPFDASELVCRIHSLVKLKEVVHHNRNLTNSEKEKNAFLYFLTHNINTPLTLLVNRIRELESLSRLEELPDIAEDLNASSREISDIVQNVLTSFRLANGRQTMRLEEVDIRRIIFQVDEDLAFRIQEKSQTLTAEIPPQLPVLRGDTMALRGIIYNLVENAVKFTPRGGAIHVRVILQDPLKIEVEDSGPGIPEEERPLLFDRFMKLSPRPTGGESSTGLGLYVARELARMSGGGLGYLAGKAGACFVLTLPLDGRLEDRS